MSLIHIPEETRVILIGSGAFIEDNTLKPIKPIEANISELKKIFEDKNIFNGIPSENVISVLNKKDYEILSIVEEQSQLSNDTLIIYYAGHGEREKGKTLYLTATNTRKDRLISTAIEFDRLYKIINSSKAPKKILILDCCYSGLAALSSDNSPFLKEELEDIQGTYIITSSPSNMVSYFDQNDEHTFFTAELLSVLKNGINNNTPFIEIGELYETIKNNLKIKNFPLPMQKNTLNASGKIYFANNFKYIEYSKIVNEADSLLRKDEFELAIKRYYEIIEKYDKYQNENIEVKLKSIESIINAEKLFSETKFEVAEKTLNNALNLLDTIQFKAGKLLSERQKIYSITSLNESKLREELKAHLTPIIRKNLEEDIIKRPDIIEKKLRENLEQEYKMKLVNVERELRQQISSEFQTIGKGRSNKKILIMTANPIDTTRLRIDEEIREIQSVLKYNNNYELCISLATKASEIDRILLETSPEFVHLALHTQAYINSDGYTLANFSFENETGRKHNINGKNLIQLIKIISSIKCVFINGCDTNGVAYFLSEYIPYTIGLEDKVDDVICILFAKSFYKALLSKEDIDFAFDFGKISANMMDDRGFNPVLYKQENFGKMNGNIQIIKEV